MKLRRVDILGFKSFRAKTGLDIADGVTVVVGPNGCGKSNIVDAIRWAIGSQSAKDLRGRAMEDVIFAGSANHRPLGVAEVSLTFETNERSDVPAAWRDHAELRITRRLFRTGESEYEINRQRVRLRDIHELFLGTGVGAKEAYSIVEQGRIGFIVSSRPQERRVIIEEAAGVTRYKYQRRTAQRRLERTRENLHRVRDVLDEVARQVASLERQAKRARRYRDLNERLTYLRAVVAFRRLERAAEAARVAGADRATRRAKVEETEGRLRAAEARVSEAALTTASAEQAWNEGTEQHFRARSRVDLLENNVVHQRREREALDERAEGLATSVEALAEAHVRHRAETERLADEVEQRSAAAMAHAAEVSELRTSLEAAREEASAQAAATESHARRIATRRGDAASAAARAEAAREEQARLSQAEETLAEEVLVASDALSLARAAHVERASALDVALAGREQAESILQASTAAERDAREALTAARQTAEASSRESARAETRFRTLDAAWRRGQGYEAATQEALAAAEQWSGQGRPLAERLEIAPHAEGFVALALGSWLDAIVVEGDAERDALLDWAVTERRALRVVRLVEPASLDLDGCVAREPVPGWVVARLEAAERARSVVDAPRGHRDERGVRVEERGAFEVVVDAAAPEAVRIRREREDAKQAKEAAKHADAAAAEAYVLAQRELECRLVDRVAARESLDEAKSDERAARTELEAARACEAQALRRAELATRASADADARRARAAELQRAAEVELEAAQREVEEATRSMDAIEGAASAALRTSRELGDRLTEAARLQASAEERARSSAEARRRSAEAADEAQRQHTAAEREIEALRKRRVEMDLQLREDQRALAAARKHADAAERELALRKAAHDAAGAQRLEREAAVLRVREEARAANEALTEVIARAERSASEAEHAEASLLEHCGLTRAAAREVVGEAMVDDGLLEERATLERRMERLGPVNPAAVEEFDEASQRHATLDEQRDDLERAMADLEAAIRRIDKASKERFGEMFTLVQERFRVLYPRLFRGGKADLVLTEPDNLLESGVEIVAQPPGKRLQSISLLSGGEKALTAVALIFAIFQLKPTPFCILDEVDAPLDDANVSRFAELVREMSETSQFLLITHNKTTMESASTLYGVTMQEPGVSNVVGVRLQGQSPDPLAG